MARTRMWKARVSDRIGSLPVTTIPEEKIEDFRDYLDGEVRARIASGKAEGISGKTAMIGLDPRTHHVQRGDQLPRSIEACAQR